jgi:hypothetical protein
MRKRLGFFKVCLVVQKGVVGRLEHNNDLSIRTRDQLCSKLSRIRELAVMTGIASIIKGTRNGQSQSPLDSTSS